MQKFVFCCLLIFTGAVWAQDNQWTKIYPVAFCDKMPIFYQKNIKGGYKVKLGSEDEVKNIPNVYEVEDLNDLSALTEVIVEKSNTYCPENLVSIAVEGSPNCGTEDFFSQDYLQFIRFTADYVNKSGNQCDNIIPFIKVQDEISQLSSEDLIKFKPSKKIGSVVIKMLSGSEVDNMVDLFHACGGKKGSDKFIQNTILLEARNSCIVPNMLSWEEAEKVAQEISADYKDTNLIKLNSSQDKLKYDASMAFTNQILKKEVDSVLGFIFEENKTKGISPQSADEFINGLDSKKRLDAFKKKEDINDYISYVFSVDAGVEIGEKAIPLFIRSSFSSKLPESWSAAKKEEFIEQKLLATGSKNYDSCMATEKKYSKYGLKNENELLAHRISLKNNFCIAHPKQCEAGNCEGSVNLMQLDDSATDTEIVQACVLQSITLSIQPLLEGIIHDQKEEFKDSFDLTDELAQDFTDDTWKTLTKCVNRRVKKKLMSEQKVDITLDQKPLQKISTADYEDILIKCADIAEAEVSGKFVNQIIINDKTIISTFGDKEVQQVAETVLDKSFEPCLEKQYQLSKLKNDPENPSHGLNQRNTMLCTPLVEMNASLLVVERQLNNVIKDEALGENEKVKKIMNNYKLCGDQALSGALTDLGSLTSSTPLNTVEDSKNYLDQNSALFNCVETAISDISYEIAGSQFEKVIADQKGKIKGEKFLASLKPEVQTKIKECLSAGIKEQQKWSNFIKFNSGDGMEKLQSRCEMEANKLVIPKLLVNETHMELGTMISDGYIKDSAEIGNILFVTSMELQKEYKIPVQNNMDGAEKIYHYYGEALQLHIERGGNVDSFVEEMSKRIETNSIKKVHSNLMGEIQSQTPNINQRSKFNSFDQYFSASCLQDIHNRFMKDSQPSSSGPMTLTTLASYMQLGLSYLEKANPMTFWEELKGLKSECDNLGNYKSKEQFHKSQFYKIILKGQIYNEFKVEFKKGIMESLAVQEKQLKDPHLDIKKKYMEDMKVRMEKLLDTYMIESTFDDYILKDGQVMDFAANNLDKLLQSDPTVKDKLSKMLVEKMFQKNGNGTFSDQFAQIQVEGNFGINGITEAHDEASNGRSLLWGLVSVGGGAGKSAARKYFGNTQNIKDVIDWKNIDVAQRKEMAKSIYFDAVAESQIKRTKPIDKYDVYGVIAKDDQFNKKIFVGKPAFIKRIDELTDKVTNGYQGYTEKVEAEAKKFAEEIFTSNPSAKNKFTKQQLSDFIATEIKKEHMERNITNRLLSTKDKNGKTIEEKIKDDITNSASDIFWGNTPEQKEQRRQREFEKMKNPWPIGPKI